MADKIHRRYYDDRKRPDLRGLARCNNLNGPICDEAHLTSDAREVTCGRCKRIAERAGMSRTAFSPATLRTISRTLSAPPAPTREQLAAMLAEARRAAFKLLTVPHGVEARNVLTALGVTRAEIEEFRRALPSTQAAAAACRASAAGPR